MPQQKASPAPIDKIAKIPSLPGQDDGTHLTTNSAEADFRFLTSDAPTDQIIGRAGRVDDKVLEAARAWALKAGKARRCGIFSHELNRRAKNNTPPGPRSTGIVEARVDTPIIPTSKSDATAQSQPKIGTADKVSICPDTKQAVESNLAGRTEAQNFGNLVSEVVPMVQQPATVPGAETEHDLISRIQRNLESIHQFAKMTVTHAVDAGKDLALLREKYGAQGKTGRGWRRVLGETLKISHTWANMLINLHRSSVADPSILNAKNVSNALLKAGLKKLPPPPAIAPDPPPPTVPSDTSPLAASDASTAPGTTVSPPDSQLAPAMPSIVAAPTGSQSIVYESAGMRVEITVRGGASEIDIDQIVDGIRTKLQDWKVQLAKDLQHTSIAAVSKRSVAQAGSDRAARHRPRTEREKAKAKPAI